VGAEPHLPYDRPPLSKDFLAGETEAEGLALRRQPYDDLDLELRLGVRATALDVGARTITTDDGDTIAYAGAVIATGAAPRRLPNTPELVGIHVLRTLDDATALRDDLARAVRRGGGCRLHRRGGRGHVPAG
jgi:NADPH-dependent 2,4-dienoyl-CoA reductase/sulfur reductase-like enzyme